MTDAREIAGRWYDRIPLTIAWFFAGVAALFLYSPLPDSIGNIALVVAFYFRGRADGLAVRAALQEEA